MSWDWWDCRRVVLVGAGSGAIGVSGGHGVTMDVEEGEKFGGPEGKPRENIYRLFLDLEQPFL